MSESVARVKEGLRERLLPARLGAGLAVLSLVLVPAGVGSAGTAAAQRRASRAERRAAERVEQRAAVGVDRRALAQAERYTGDRFRFLTETPRGVRVASVNRPRAEMLSAVDRGLDELFAAARRQGYRARLSHAEYTIFIARADRTRDRDGRYSPDVAVGAAQYAGSDYDQGGHVFAAGIVSSFAPGSFVIAEHERDFNRVADVVRYEGEHIILYHNDQRRFRATADHSRGGSHPIIQ